MRAQFAKVLILMPIVLFALPARAAVVVTEIMYNPLGSNAGHQWLELVNTGPDLVDLGAKNIRLFDGSGNHVIKPYGSTKSTLAPGEVAVIAQNPLTFLTDYSLYGGLLFKSALSLSASSLIPSADIVGITDTSGTVLAKALYDPRAGAAGDGNSLQRTLIDSIAAFKPAAPTPGVAPLVLPAQLSAPVKVKQITLSKSTNKSKQHTSSITSTTSSKNHGKGTVAPATPADAEVAGALPTFGPLESLLASPLFAAFLGLLAFSTFSLILIQQRSRHTHYS
jgi:hypothetical protein